MSSYLTTAELTAALASQTPAAGDSTEALLAKAIILLNALTGV